MTELTGHGTLPEPVELESVDGVALGMTVKIPGKDRKIVDVIDGKRMIKSVPASIVLTGTAQGIDAVPNGAYYIKAPSAYFWGFEL